jgi:hypothetical protein
MKTLFFEFLYLNLCTMKRLKLHSKIKLFCLVLFLSVAPMMAHGQIDVGSDSDGTDVVDTPIDGGDVLLIVAGLGLGIMKIYKMKNKTTTEKATAAL